MEKLSLEEKIGQMIIYGINEENVKDRLIKMIKDYKIGGIILYKKNYKTSEELIDLVFLKPFNKDDVAYTGNVVIRNHYGKITINLYMDIKNFEIY